MAKTQDTAPDQVDTLGAGTTPDPATLPGGANFNVDTASDGDYEQHFKILKRRADLATLNTPTAVPSTLLSFQPQAQAVGHPAPLSESDIVAVHPKYGERGFSDLTWAALETKGEHGGWEIKVDKPADL